MNSEPESLEAPLLNQNGEGEAPIRNDSMVARSYAAPTGGRNDSMVARSYAPPTGGRNDSMVAIGSFDGEDQVSDGFAREEELQRFPSVVGSFYSTRNTFNEGSRIRLDSIDSRDTVTLTKDSKGSDVSRPPGEGHHKSSVEDTTWFCCHYLGNLFGYCFGGTAQKAYTSRGGHRYARLSRETLQSVKEQESGVADAISRSRFYSPAQAAASRKQGSFSHRASLGGSALQASLEGVHYPSVRIDGGSDTISDARDQSTQDTYERGSQRRVSFADTLHSLAFSDQTSLSALNNWGLLSSIIKGGSDTPREERFDSLVTSATDFSLDSNITPPQRESLQKYYENLRDMSRDQLKELPFTPPHLRVFRKALSPESSLMIKGSSGKAHPNQSLAKSNKKGPPKSTLVTLLEGYEESLKKSVEVSDSTIGIADLEKKLLLEKLDEVKKWSDMLLSKIVEASAPIEAGKSGRISPKRTLSKKIARQNQSSDTHLLENLRKGCDLEQAVIQSDFPRSSIEVVEDNFRSHDAHFHSAKKTPRSIKHRERFFKTVINRPLGYFNREQLGFDKDSQSAHKVVNHEVAAARLAKLLGLYVPHTIPAVAGAEFGSAALFIKEGFHLYEIGEASINDIYHQNPKLLFNELIPFLSQRDSFKESSHPPDSVDLPEEKDSGHYYQEKINNLLATFIASPGLLPYDWRMEVLPPLRQDEVDGPILLPNGAPLMNETDHDLSLQLASEYFRDGMIRFIKPVVTTVSDLELSSPELQKAFANMQIFDLLMNNTDRNPFNYILRPYEGGVRLYMIDHALCFGAKGGANELLKAYALAAREAESQGKKIFATQALTGHSICDKLPNRMPRLIDRDLANSISEISEKDMKSYLATSYLNPEELAALCLRLRQLKKYIYQVSQGKIEGAKIIQKWDEVTYNEVVSQRASSRSNEFGQSYLLDALLTQELKEKELEYSKPWLPFLIREEPSEDIDRAGAAAASTSVTSANLSMKGFDPNGANTGVDEANLDGQEVSISDGEDQSEKSEISDDEFQSCWSGHTAGGTDRIVPVGDHT